MPSSTMLAKAGCFARSGRSARPALAALLSLHAATAIAELPAVPEPPENPITEDKRILGKMLFWDEQLSSDNSVACGTCHLPAFGGGDPRAGLYPGQDPGTIDDVHGSPGIVSLDARGRPQEHPVFGFEPQVTPRSSPSNFGALWADEQFWDGRASSRFVDPLSGEVAIASGGSLETQALTALLNDAEMSKTGRRWSEVTAKLERVVPLALATGLPADVGAKLETLADYPALFAAAFGDPAITPVRIAFALASYQRTLVADQTPWDRYRAGDEDALSSTERYGMRALEDFQCVKCHTPPLFTNNDYLNVGVRRAEYDPLRQTVTGDPEDAGEVKVPSLRNVGLRARFMHTGEFANLGAAISFYRTGPALPERDAIPGGGIYAFNMGAVTDADIRAFLDRALTDPRVRDEVYPFDRPTLRTERDRDDKRPPDAPQSFRAEHKTTSVELRWEPVADALDYVVWRDDEVIALTTRTQLEDGAKVSGSNLRYRLVARDAAQNEAPAVQAEIIQSR